MKRTLIVIIICVVAVLAIVVTAKHASTLAQQTPVVQVATAETGSLQADIMAQGSIVPVTQANVSVLPQFEGQVQQVLVQVGDRVQQGEILARLDATDEEAELDQARSDADRVAAMYQLTLHPHRSEEIEKEKATLDFDRHSEEQAHAQLLQLVHGPRPQEVAYSEAQVDAAQTALTQAETSYEYDKKLFDKELESKAQLQNSESNVDTAKSSLEEAQAQLSFTKAGSRPEAVAAAEAQYQAALAYYQEDQQTYDMMIRGSRPEEIDKAAAELRKADQVVAEDQTILTRQVIRAPISGVITERDVNPGDVVTPAPTRSSRPLGSSNQTLFVVADDSTVYFEANVDARFFPYVHVGQPAKISFETDLGHSYLGTVARTRPVINPLTVSQSASTPANPADVPLTFDVWVSLPNAERKLTIGEIGVTNLTQQSASGVLMPQGALTPFSSGNGVVYVENNGVVNVRDVKYGDVVGDKVRILSGVQPGEHVVVSTPFQLADGMHVTPVSANEPGAHPMM